MNTAWLKHLKGEDRENFKGYLLNSSGVFDRMQVILDSFTKVEKRDDYKESGWPYLRAYDDGYNQAIKDVIDLITLTKGD